MDLGAASTRASHLALVVALVLGLLGAGCLSWEPEPNADWAEIQGYAFELWTDDQMTLTTTYDFRP